MFSTFERFSPEAEVEADEEEESEALDCEETFINVSI